MKKPSNYTILAEAQLIMSMVHKFGDKEISEAEKVKLSNDLALLVERIRIKYQLQSKYYFPGEVKAKEKCFQLYGKDVD